jgi:UbiD family decarboxylase
MAVADTERFRLRRYVERLVQLGECEVHDQPIDLIDVGAVLDGNPRATWFKSVGPEKAELIGNVMGSRKRLALALDTDEAGLLRAITERLANPYKPVKVAAAEAPVQQVVLQGEDADLCALPVHLQHGEDGAPYISAGLDVMQFRDSGHTNIGCRRIMLRGPRTAGIDMIAPSDARAIYLDAVAKGEKTPVAYVVGSTPCDFMAAGCMNPPMDELEVLGALRGAPVPVVKCVTNDIYVPADAEYVLEGYLDP